MPASSTRNTSVGGQFGVGIFAGIQRNTPVFIMEYPDSEGLHAFLFCLGLSGRKEDGKIETATLEGRQKKQLDNKAKQQLCTCIRLCCTFRCCQYTTTTWKCLIFTFYGGRKHCEDEMFPLFLNFLGIQLLKRGHLHYFDKVSELE